MAIVINASIGNAVSRASGSDGTQWDNGDCIGVTGAGYTNIPYVLNNNRFEPQSAVIYFNDADTKTFNAYYPYNAAGGTLAATTDATAQRGMTKTTGHSGGRSKGKGNLLAADLL